MSGKKYAHYSPPPVDHAELQRIRQVAVCRDSLATACRQAEPVSREVAGSEWALTNEQQDAARAMRELRSLRIGYSAAEAQRISDRGAELLAEIYHAAQPARLRQRIFTKLSSLDQQLVALKTPDVLAGNHHSLAQAVEGAKQEVRKAPMNVADQRRWTARVDDHADQLKILREAAEQYFGCERLLLVLANRSYVTQADLTSWRQRLSTAARDPAAMPGTVEEIIRQAQEKHMHPKGGEELAVLERQRRALDACSTGLGELSVIEDQLLDARYARWCPELFDVAQRQAGQCRAELAKADLEAAKVDLESLRSQVSHLIGETAERERLAEKQEAADLTRRVEREHEAEQQRREIEEFAEIVRETFKAVSDRIDFPKEKIELALKGLTREEPVRLLGRLRGQDAEVAIAIRYDPERSIWVLDGPLKTDDESCEAVAEVLLAAERVSGGRIQVFVEESRRAHRARRAKQQRQERS